MLHQVHEVLLNAGPTESKCVCESYLTSSRVWIQHGQSIYYFRVQNDIENAMITYSLCRFDLAREQEEEVRTWEMSWVEDADQLVDGEADDQEKEIEKEGMRSYQVGIGVVFAKEDIELKE